jgi:hypothetical protein
MIRLKTMLLEQKAAGSQWHSCKAWKAKGTSYWNGDQGRPKITIEVNDSGFLLKYVGAASGFAISHANDGTGDTLHQAFNVVMCECNPYLIKGGLKPDIENISTNDTRVDGKHKMNIWIPFIKADGTWQVNRRGGMGWDPGSKAVIKAVGDVPNLQGPVKVVTGSITEYFVTYTISDSPKKSADKKDDKKDGKQDVKLNFKIEPFDPTHIEPFKLDLSTLSTFPTLGDTGTVLPPKSNIIKDTDWSKYPGDEMYIYQKRGEDWYAKNKKTGQEYNISDVDKYKSSVDNLEKALKAKKLIKV